MHLGPRGGRCHSQLSVHTLVPAGPVGSVNAFLSLRVGSAKSVNARSVGTETDDREAVGTGKKEQNHRRRGGGARGGPYAARRAHERTRGRAHAETQHHMRPHAAFPNARSRGILAICGDAHEA